MEAAAGAFGAIGESVVFLDHFKDLPDPRQRGKITYPLAEVLLLCLLAVLGGAETFVDIARFGEKKIDLLLEEILNVTQLDVGVVFGVDFNDLDTHLLRLVLNCPLEGCDVGNRDVGVRDAEPHLAGEFQIHPTRIRAITALRPTRPTRNWADHVLITFPGPVDTRCIH